MENITSEYVKFDGDGKEQMKLEQMKLEQHSEFVSSMALSFVKFTIQRPPVAEWKALVLFIILRTCFVLYALCLWSS
jgi:hypothetical protein